MILGEGKSYRDELFGSGCQASPGSRAMIEAALARTRRWLGVVEGPARWCGRLYQTANRLAYLYFLREVVGVRSWFVHLLFTDDPHRPTTADEWEDAIGAADTELGLKSRAPGVGHVVLAAGPRDELVGAGLAD